MTPYRGLLWDKDGTLLDTFAFWVGLERRLALVLGERFLTADPREYVERVLTALGVGADGRVSAAGVLAAGTEKDILGVFYQSLGQPPARAEFDLEARTQLDILLHDPPAPVAMAGIREVLENARDRGLHQGVATADTAANVARDLVRSGLAPFFGFVSSSDSERVKPDPWPVLAFAKWAGIAPAEVLVIGDTPVDEAMAAAAGAGFAGVLWGTGRREDFPQARLVASAQEVMTFWDLT